MKTDVLVLGAGIVGVSTALHLLDRGRSVVLVDRAEPAAARATAMPGSSSVRRSFPSFPRDPIALVRYALNGQSDVRYSPFFLPKAASFLWQYWRNSAAAPLAVATRAMLPLVEACLPEHDRLVARAGAQHLIRAEGWVALYKTRPRFEAAIAEAVGWRPMAWPIAFSRRRFRCAGEAGLPTGRGPYCRRHPLAGPEDGDRSAGACAGLCRPLRVERRPAGRGRCRNPDRDRRWLADQGGRWRDDHRG